MVTGSTNPSPRSVLHRGRTCAIARNQFLGLQMEVDRLRYPEGHSCPRCARHGQSGREPSGGLREQAGRCVPWQKPPTRGEAASAAIARWRKGAVAQAPGSRPGIRDAGSTDGYCAPTAQVGNGRVGHSCHIALAVDRHDGSAEDCVGIAGSHGCDKSDGLLLTLAAEQTIEKPSEQTAGNWSNPEKPKLSQCPASHVHRDTGTASRVH